MKEWEKLPKEYQAAFEAAAAEANIDMMAKYDFKNPKALRSLIFKGVQLRAYSPELMKVAQIAAFELYDEEAAKNPSFKRIYVPWRAFREEVVLWHRVAEKTYNDCAAANPPPAMR